MMSVKSGPISSFCGKLQDTLSSCSRDVLYRFSGLVEERFGSQFREVTKLVGINFGSWRKLPALLSCSKWCYRILGSSVQELDVHESMISCPWWKVALWHSCWRVQTVHFSLLSSWKCSHTSVVIWLRDREVHETFQYDFRAADICHHCFFANETCYYNFRAGNSAIHIICTRPSNIISLLIFLGNCLW